MIDISKIKVGDEVTVRGKVVGLPIKDREPKYGPVVMFGGGFETTNVICSDDMIVTHTPAPREIKVGDRVHITRSGIDSSRIWLVRAVDAGEAWLSSWTGKTTVVYPEQRIESVGDLRHAEDAQ